MTDAHIDRSAASPAATALAATSTTSAAAWEPLEGLLEPDELVAVETLRVRLGYDPARTPKFWEDVVARELGGVTTEHRCQWDVRVDLRRISLFVEVKFSQEFSTPKAAGREPESLFAWALPQGKAPAGKGADVIVFIGIDSLDNVSFWAVPSALIPPRHPRIAVVPPRVRKRVVPSVLTAWACQPTQLALGVAQAFMAQQQLVPDAPRMAR